MKPFEVMCLEDKDRPEIIPTSAWVKKGKLYTVIKADRMRMQGGALGYKLLEIDLDPYFPYQYFGAWRFGIIVTNMMDEKEVNKVIQDLDNILEQEEISILETA